MNGCLKDQQGQTSTMRVMCFIALLTAIGLSTAGLVLGTPVDSDVIMWFLIGAFGGKAGQKFGESK